MSAFWKLKHLLLGRCRATKKDVRAELESLASLAQEDGKRSDTGNLTFVAEEARAVFTWTWLDQFIVDLKYACRTMGRNPGFTFVAVCSLALGIGANTTIFSLIHAILLKPLPVEDPGRLAVLTSYSKDGKIGDFGYGDYLAIRNETSAFEGIAAASISGPIGAGVGADSETVQRKIVSANYFSILRVHPAIGRRFADGEDDQQLAVISDRWWRRSFGASPDVIGKQVELEGKSFTVIGVAPPQFLSETLGESVDVWVTTALMPPALRMASGYTWLYLIGRLKSGVSIKQAGVSLSGLGRQMQNRFIERVDVAPGGSGSSELQNTFSVPLKVLMGMVAVALLLTCANLASLLLARAASRQHEIASRLALGASRIRIFRQLITESLVLAFAGGFLGLAMSGRGQQVLLDLVSGAGKTISLDLRPDFPVLVFNAAISLLTGFLFGVTPAIHALRQNVSEGLKLSAPSTTSGRRGVGLRGGLVASQAALSLVLLIVGGLFIRTLQNLKNQDLGLRVPNVLSVQFDAPRQYHPAWAMLILELLRRVEAVPGVKSACVSFDGALGNVGGVRGFRFEGFPPLTTDDQRASASWVSPRYFETLGIPLFEGREFSPRDDANSPQVVIINRTMARRYMGTDHAVGRHFVFNGKSYEIIGIAKEVKRGDLRSPIQPLVYFSALQSGSAVHALEVRTTTSPAAVAPDIRRVVQDVDPRLRIVATATLQQVVNLKLGREILVADLAALFAGLTLMLVILGVYGTVAYSVARRTKEIGIRIVLGAGPANITAMVLRPLLFAIGAGAIVGTAIAMAAGRLVKVLLFGLNGADLQTISAAVLILCFAALTAGYLPVRRALRLDPTNALRLE